MKAFLSACVAMAAISVGAYYVLNAVGPSTAEQNSAESVRLGELPEGFGS